MMPVDRDDPYRLAKVRRKAHKLRLTEAERHILVCGDTRQGSCASPKAMKGTWKFLKRRLKELGLQRRVRLSRADCFGLCCGGPIVIVYPEGAWYGRCEPDVLEEILQQHILQGRPLQSHLLFPLQQGEHIPLQSAAVRGACRDVGEANSAEDAATSRKPR